MHAQLADRGGKNRDHGRVIGRAPTGAALGRARHRSAWSRRRRPRRPTVQALTTPAGKATAVPGSAGQTLSHSSGLAPKI